MGLDYLLLNSTCEECRGPKSCLLPKEHGWGGFLNDPVFKNPPCNAGHAGSILGQGTKIPHAIEQLSPYTATAEPVYAGACAPK